jgi:hypothetical protein
MTTITRTTIARTAIARTAIAGPTPASAPLSLFPLSASVVFLLVDPAFDPDDAPGGAGFGESEIDRYPQCLKRHFPASIFFGTGNVRTRETPGATQSDAFGAEIHRRLERTLHGAPESDPSLQLDRHILGHQLGVEFRLADLENIDLHLRSAAHLAHVVGHLLDLGPLSADDQPRAGSVQGYAHTIPRAFDDDLGDCRHLKPVLEILPDRQIAVQLLGEIALGRVPFGSPVSRDGEAKTYRMNFLTHDE